MQGQEQLGDEWQYPASYGRHPLTGWTVDLSTPDRNARKVQGPAESDDRIPVDWESFSLLGGRRLRWHRLGPLKRSTKLVDLHTDQVVASLRSKRSFLVGFRAGAMTYGIRSVAHMYQLVDENTGVVIFTWQGEHKPYKAETRVYLPSGTTVTLPVNGRSRRRAVLHAVANDGSVLFYLRWRWGSLWAGVAGLEVAVAPGQILNAELLGLIYLSSTEIIGNYFALWVPGSH